MPSKVKKALFGLVALFVVASVVHYALFGSFPFGKPQLMDDEELDAEEDESEADAEADAAQ
ncbi:MULTISPECIES: hypothetical protein [Haloprofundus]|uniref:hypothetical protein n=1 Tax=Haloprofundus TaxID=1911573 RepID=UPI000E44E728|nr:MULTISPECIES: hypothetical protein [Haloprofundus]QCJ46886.1 hypothetical protein FCF25_07075 [Haloprofundus sp. MHR1]